MTTWSRASVQSPEPTRDAMEDMVVDHNHVSSVPFKSWIPSFRHTHTASVQQHSQTGVPPQLTHVPTMLIEYWFKRVCPAISAYDLKINPLRWLAGKSWQSSSMVYKAMLSTATACSKDQLPHFSSTKMSLQFRMDASRELKDELSKVDQGLLKEATGDMILASYLLGFSSSWLDTQSLGIEYFHIARKIITSLSSNSRNCEELQFFVDGLALWEMLLAAAGAGVELGGDSNDSQTSERSVLAGMNREEYKGKASSVSLHPLTAGLAPAQRLLARILLSSHDHWTLNQQGRLSRRKDLHRAIQNFQTAQVLEEMALELQVPDAENFAETDDNHTPRLHFMHLAQAHHAATLLQLYQGFPDLIDLRLGHSDTSETRHFMIAMAISIVDAIKKIPVTSGTRCMLPILLVIASTELRFRPTIPSGTGEKNVDLDNWSIFSHDISIAQNRTFTLDCLSSFERSLPVRPITDAIRLVREVWEKLDRGEEFFWVDVMLELGLPTIWC